MKVSHNRSAFCLSSCSKKLPAPAESNDIIHWRKEKIIAVLQIFNHTDPQQCKSYQTSRPILVFTAYYLRLVPPAKHITQGTMGFFKSIPLGIWRTKHLNDCTIAQRIVLSLAPWELMTPGGVQCSLHGINVPTVRIVWSCGTGNVAQIYLFVRLQVFQNLKHQAIFIILEWMNANEVLQGGTYYICAWLSIAALALFANKTPTPGTIDRSLTWAVIKCAIADSNLKRETKQSSNMVIQSNKVNNSISSQDQGNRMICSIYQSVGWVSRTDVGR